MKKVLLEIFACDRCGGQLESLEDKLKCQNCGHTIPVHENTPVFSPPPDGLQPSKKVERGPNLGTPWRQANWLFLKEQLGLIDSEALILDVGAGRGDFADLLIGLNSIALDIYPYPEVDVVCDLTQVNPFRPKSFDAILLLNVLEHIYNTHEMLAILSNLLKPGGFLLVAIPFMVKMHQVPIDFVRYTHFYLEKMGVEHQLTVEKLEGFYDPVFFLNEGIGNIKWSILPGIHGLRHYLGRILLRFLQLIASGLRVLVGHGKLLPPSQTRSLAPTGYHIIYRKPVQ